MTITNLGNIFLVMVLGCLFLISMPANAQYVGNDSHESKVVSTVESSSNLKALPNSPSLKAAQPGPDATIIQGVNTAATVKVNNLAMLEALLNIGANGIEIIGVLWGICLLLACFRKMSGDQRLRSFAIAAITVVVGLEVPFAVSWIFSICRDANLFS